MAVILITGADGQLGNEIRLLSGNYYGYEFIFTDIESLDITDREKTRNLISDIHPDWIINCAAYNLVDKAETESDKAILINSTAVKNIAESLIGTDCRFIHISTDYVFDGQSNVPYNEHSATDPLGAYGKSKLMGEKAALSHYNSMIIRTSWLYSSFGTNFVKTILRKAKEKDTLKVVFDQTGTPTYAADLAGAITEIISSVIRNQSAFNTGIYHYSNEGVCSWYDLAAEVVSEAGIDCRILPVLSSEYQTAAKRPVYSVMNKTRIKENYNIIIPHWRTSLKRCMNILKNKK